ncbi:O-antigen ligase family protein [Patescibacteria group bacterium]|nr:O-antigen ligase family protein [Patescibacteria group bacterium]
MLNKALSWLIILLPLALPLYVVRFEIGSLPTTLLEVYLLLLLLTCILSFLRPSDPSSKSPAIRNLSGVLQEVRQKIGAWFWPLICWLVVTLVAVFVATDSWGALGHWRAFILEPVMIFVLLLTYKPITTKVDVLRNIFYSIAGVTILLGVYSIVQYLTGWGIPSPWDAWNGRRSTGVFGYPNGLSLFIVPFGVVSFIKLLEIANEKYAQIMNGKSILFLVATICAGIATTLAKSMGGILAFGIGVVLTLVLFKKTRIVGIVLMVIGLLGAGMVAWQIYGTELHPQTIEDSLAASKKWSSSVRVIIWKESWEIIKGHPILGTGLRSYKTALIPYHQATWMEIFPHPHNIFLMLWIETGLLGLLAFIWLIGTWATSVIRPTPQSSHVNGANDAGRARRDILRYVWLIPLIVILTHGMVDMPYFKNDLAVQFFLLAAIATLASRHPELSSESNQNKV